jgi:DNA-binding response OmpR family regulator
MTTKLVLVADDDEDTVSAYEMLFRSRGYAMEAASDGPATLYRALELRPDLIVLDLGLPLMDGLEVLRRLRAAGIPRIPVLILTGRAHPEAAAAARREGADDVMTKPCEPLELCARVEMLLQMAAAPTAAEQPPDADDPGSGRIRITRPRYERRLAQPLPPEEPVGEWPAADLTPHLWRTAMELSRRASVLRWQAAELQARARDIRAQMGLPWRRIPARAVPVSE